jgi:hypothetical protein
MSALDGFLAVLAVGLVIAAIMLVATARPYGR